MTIVFKRKETRTTIAVIHSYYSSSVTSKESTKWLLMSEVEGVGIHGVSCFFHWELYQVRQ